MKNQFEDLIQIRKNVTENLRSQLLGPGSEIDYPDREHELISEQPQSRYTTGILFPQGMYFDEPIVKENTEEVDEDIDDTETDPISVSINSKTLQEDTDDLDDSVNMSNQFKPSSMGLTFYINKNIDILNFDLHYAIYEKDKNIEIKNELNYKPILDEVLLPYLTFNEETNTFKKGNYITYKNIESLFNKNDIEDRNLLMILNNLNSVFPSGYGYRRCPIIEKITLSFTHNKLCKVNTRDNRLQITAVKRKLNEECYSITIMLLNNTCGNKPEHIFQPEIKINSRSNNFMFSTKARIQYDVSDQADVMSMNFLYRNKKIYATGHGVSVNWDINNDEGVIYTEYLPEYEVPSIDLNIRQETDNEKQLDPNTMSMKYLSDISEVSKNEIINNLKQFILNYKEWIEKLDGDIKSKKIEIKYLKTATKHIEECDLSYNRMLNGIKVLENNNLAWRAFNLANRAMFMQRHHIEIQKNSSEYVYNTKAIEYKSIDYQKYKWRPFQLAFILQSIVSIVDVNSEDRKFVDLIWFPTGGGKTEAYLGLTAFTIFYRRLAFSSESGGTTVLMRYTLRLLTSQQFYRASSLICACELIRREISITDISKTNLGNEEISIGLWIGGGQTPNNNDIARREYDNLKKNVQLNNSETENVFQLNKCPWCGSDLKPHKTKEGRFVEGGYKFKNNKSFYFNCTNSQCHFRDKLPIQIVDEEIYKEPPTLLLATVDKFALIPWVSEAGELFNKNGNRNPELIIQDELHLISGPLGTIVGLYETAVDFLCSHKGIKPKIVASTATISHAHEQSRLLYNRDVKQFPASGLDISDSYFSREISIDQKYGRLYLGVIPTGYSKVMFQARLLAILLQGICSVDASDNNKDKYWTLTSYFNTLKELGKTASLIEDDVKDFIRRIYRRKIIQFSNLRKKIYVEELTSRVSSSDLNATLENLLNRKYTKEEYEKYYDRLVDVLLATNMISVGIDVDRLNLMIIQGQPKNTNEYIQASSRIGRSYPGLAITLYDNTKSRDRSHYEHFRSYHEAFYKFVEPTGITPFSKPARERALHAVVISILRQTGYQFRNDSNLKNVNKEVLDTKLNDIINYVVNRVNEINKFNPSGYKDDIDDIRSELEDINQWVKNKLLINDNVSYGKMTNKHSNQTKRLMKTPDDSLNDGAKITLTSMRNIESSLSTCIKTWDIEED